MALLSNFVFITLILIVAGFFSVGQEGELSACVGGGGVGTGYDIIEYGKNFGLYYITQ